MNLAWISLLATVFCSCGGNTLANWSNYLKGRYRLLCLLAAIGCHGLGVIFYSLALTGIPLGIAYPTLIGGSMACVAVIAAIVFREQLSPRRLAGLALIGLGIFLLQGTSVLHPAATGQAALSPAGDR